MAAPGRFLGSRRVRLAAVSVAILSVGYVAAFLWMIRVAVVDYFDAPRPPDPPDFVLAYSEDPAANSRARLAFWPLIALMESTGRFEWDDSGSAAEGWRLAQRFILP